MLEFGLLVLGIAAYCLYRRRAARARIRTYKRKQARDEKQRTGGINLEPNRKQVDGATCTGRPSDGKHADAGLVGSPCSASSSGRPATQ